MDEGDNNALHRKSGFFSALRFCQTAAKSQSEFVFCCFRSLKFLQLQQEPLKHRLMHMLQQLWCIFVPWWRCSVCVSSFFFFLFYCEMLCFGLQGHRTYYKRSTVFFHNSSFLRKINSDPIWMTERQQFSGTWTLPEYMSFKLLHASWCTIFFTATITSYFLDFTHKPCQKQFIVNAFTNTSVSFGLLCTWCQIRCLWVDVQEKHISPLERVI